MIKSHQMRLLYELRIFTELTPTKIKYKQNRLGQALKILVANVKSIFQREIVPVLFLTSLKYINAYFLI